MFNVSINAAFETGDSHPNSYFLSFNKMVDAPTCMRGRRTTKASLNIGALRLGMIIHRVFEERASFK
jgi:hypothetical protein